MPKKIIDIESLGVGLTTVRAMANTIGRVMGDEVYLKPVLEIESTEPVIKALDAILDGVSRKPKNKAKAAT